MKQVQKQLCCSLAAAAVVLGLAVVPVSAEQSVSGSTGSVPRITPINGKDGGPTGLKDPSPPRGSQTTDSTSSDSQSQSGGGTGGHGTGLEGMTENDGQGSKGLQSQAATLLQQDRQKVKEHSAAERLQACNTRKAHIDEREAQFSAQAAKHLDAFNSIFAKVQSFHDSKGLTVANYSALVADATAKQATAQSAVTALKALDVNIDCSQPDPASTVATIKTATSSARTALQNYRTSLKNLIVALKGASTAQNNTQSTTNTQTTGGAQ
jgi:hypothetical protein